MAPAWPVRMQNKTQIRISQILWTLHLDFDGVIDSDDAPRDLLDAIRARGVDAKSESHFRNFLAHLDGGQYGTLIHRTITDNKRTRQIKLVAELPPISYLSDMPARGPARDVVPSPPEPARGSRDVRPCDYYDTGTEPARGSSRDWRDGGLSPAWGLTHDQEDGERPAWGLTHDQEDSAQGLACDDGSSAPFDDLIAELDAGLEALQAPYVDSGLQGPAELLDTIVGLVADLEGQLTGQVDDHTGRDEAEWEKLEGERKHLAGMVSRLLRRAKDAEERLVERNKQLDSLQLQLKVADERYRQLEANMEAVMRGEQVAGKNLRKVQRFIAERPHERRGATPVRTRGSDSKLVYSVG